MTTIAYDGVVLAADAAAFTANIKQPIIKLRKLYITTISDVARDRMGLPITGSGNFCYAFCGAVETINEILLWIKHGRELPDTDKNVADYGIIVQAVSGRAFVLLPNMTTYETVAPLTSGGGMRYAMGALNAGASAVVAIENTIKYTTHAGIATVQWDVISDTITSTNTDIQRLIYTQGLNHGV